MSTAGVHTFNLPNASATARGVVTTGTQTFAGVKTFDAGDIRGGNTSTFRIYTSTAPSDGRSALRIETNLTTVSLINSGGGIVDIRNTSPEFSLTGNMRFGQFGNQVEFSPDAADTMAQRRGTNAQTYRVYNTYTSATSYERLNIAWASNICTIEVTAGSGGGTLRGLRIGGATTSLVGLWGATPIAQPTTAVAAATRVGGGGTALTDTDTFDGYTLSQIVKALRNIGALA